MTDLPAFKSCLGCKHCFIDAGGPAYSEVTPGDPFECYCRKQHWSIPQSEFYAKTLSEVIFKALDCKDYEE